MGQSFICYRMAGQIDSWTIYRVARGAHEPVLYFDRYLDAARMLRALRRGEIAVH